jgi:single stranded DNA-binding protein
MPALSQSLNAALERRRPLLSELHAQETDCYRLFRREETDWFNVVAWGNLAELCEKRFLNGQQVYVEGRLQTRGWEDSNGRKHFRTEVVAQELISLAQTER